MATTMVTPGCMIGRPRVKPELLKTVIASLRAHPSWSVHVRNRGMSATDEVEIALEKTFPTDERSLPEL